MLAVWRDSEDKILYRRFNIHNDIIKADSIFKAHENIDSNISHINLNGYEGFIVYSEDSSQGEGKIQRYKLIDADLSDIGIVVEDTDVGEMSRVLMSGICNEFSNVKCGEQFTFLRNVGYGVSSDSIFVIPYWEELRKNETNN